MKIELIKEKGSVGQDVYYTYVDDKCIGSSVEFTEEKGLKTFEEIKLVLSGQTSISATPCEILKSEII